MKEKVIRFCYRKIIDSSSEKVWDQYVFESSYKEFLMQAQYFNQEKKYTKFAELLLNVPGSVRLHSLVSTAITGYVQQLNEKIPDILDNLGRHFLEFKQYRFEIINSDIKNKDAHKVAINFFSKSMIWHETIGNYLLVFPSDLKNSGENEILTHLVQIQPFLSIYSINESENHETI